MADPKKISKTGGGTSCSNRIKNTKNMKPRFHIFTPIENIIEQEKKHIHRITKVLRNGTDVYSIYLVKKNGQVSILKILIMRNVPLVQISWD